MTITAVGPPRASSGRPRATGDYYVEVSGFGSDTGSYTLTVAFR